MGMWGEYVTVAVRKSRAKKEMQKLQNKGQKIEPVEIEGKQIARNFWGKKWCDHLETFADYDNRLPRGRTYARNGSICHLSIKKGAFEAIVSGSDLYTISIHIKALAEQKWEAIKKRCSGQIGSILELLQGKLSHHVMEIVADHKEGLFPNENEITFSCNCLDWAGMCKHVAAVLYGVGNRLDHQPELLFLLRGVDPSDLVSTQLSVDTNSTINQLDNENLGDIFGIDLDQAMETKPFLEEVQEATDNKKKSKNRLNLDNLTGKKLSAFREGTGLSVIEFANALKVTPASIYRWEDSQGILNLNSRSKKALTDFLQNKRL